MSSTPKLSAAFPWAKTPLICNAPMAGGATPALASEVSRVGGLGMELTDIEHRKRPRIDDSQASSDA